MMVPWNFITVPICVLLGLIINCEAKWGGGRSSSRGGGSHRSPSYSSPSHRTPSYHSPSSYSHPSPSYSFSSPSYSHPSPSAPPSYHSVANTKSHPSPPPSYHSVTNTKSYGSAPPAYSTISKGNNVGTSHSYGPHVPTAPKLPIGPPAYNPSYGWKVTPKNTGSNNVAQKSYNQPNSGYARPSPKSVGPVGPGSAPGPTISATKISQTSSSNPTQSGGINSGLNYPRQQYIQPNHNNPTSYTNQNQFPSSPPHQPTVINNFVTTNHHSNFHTPSYSPAPYHFVSYNHYPSPYYSPFRDYYPISLGLHLYSSSHLGYGGYGDHHHYHHHTYSNSPSTSTQGNINSNPSNLGPNQNNNNIPNAGGSYQNGTTNDGITHKPDPFERSQPLIYTIPAQKKGDDDADSTEIIFTNPYLIVGVENVLFYGEFHDDEDTMIFIDQGSDGLEPVQPSNQPNYYGDTNLTSSTTTANNNTIVLETTLAPSTETSTDNQKQVMTTTTAPNTGTLSFNTTSQPIVFTTITLPTIIE